MHQSATWNGSMRTRAAALADSGEAREAGRGDHCACDIVLDVGEGPGQVYNEEAFRYFLGSERRRSQMTGSPFLVMLIDFDHALGGTALEDAAARALFSRIARCLRETDIVGWYRDGRVAGAVVTHLSGAQLGEVRAHMLDRTERLLKDTLEPELASALRVRVFQVP